MDELTIVASTLNASGVNVFSGAMPDAVRQDTILQMAAADAQGTQLEGGYRADWPHRPDRT